jgi:predicted small secreted protein
MKKLAFLITAALVLAGCNTVHGIGQDVERAGQAIGNAAK